MNTVDSQLMASAADSYPAPLRNQLWATLDAEIKLPECVIYSYRPDFSSDPYGEEGTIWSFNYFFYNRRLKRLAFFTCHASASKPDSFVDCNGDDPSMTMDFDCGPNDLSASHCHY